MSLLNTALGSLQPLCVQQNFPVITDVTLLALVAAPHFLYAFIWFLPDAWRRMFGKKSVSAFAFVAYIGKLLQFGSVLVWFGSNRANGICLDTTLITLEQFAGFLQLLAIGQALNVGIYRAIGEAGVYYGFKLGHTIPWHTGFPFNVVKHPQYVGSVATVLAFAVLVMNQAPSGLAVLALYWTLLYVVTGIWEQLC